MAVLCNTIVPIPCKKHRGNCDHTGKLKFEEVRVSDWGHMDLRSGDTNLELEPCEDDNQAISTFNWHS